MKTITMETLYRKHRRTEIAELREVTQSDINLLNNGDKIPEYWQSLISISKADRENGSPKIGDMIARNPKNHADQWLVAEQYYKDNFVLMENDPTSQLQADKAELLELRSTIEEFRDKANQSADNLHKRGLQSSGMCSQAMETAQRSFRI